MDTKLKNRHKLAIFLIIITIISAAGFMSHQYIQAYYTAQHNVESLNTEAQDDEPAGQSGEEMVQTDQDFMDKFVAAAYILYHTEDRLAGESKQKAEEIEKAIYGTSYGGDIEEYGQFFRWLNYRVVDENDQVIDKTMVEEGTDGANGEDMSTYALAMTICYDENGEPTATISQSEFANVQRSNLTRGLHQFQDSEAAEVFRGFDLDLNRTPKNRTYYFGMYGEDLEQYVEYKMNIDGYEVEDEVENEIEYVALPGWIFSIFLLVALIVAVIAWVLPYFSTLHTGEEKIFTVPPFELPVLILGVAYVNVVNLTISSSVYSPYGTEIVWLAVFAAIYWSSACLRHIYTWGPKVYFKEHTVTPFLWMKGKKGWEKGKEKWGSGLDRLYHSFDNIDFSEKNNKVILKLVLINFAILFIITCMWYVGIFVLILYSVILFYILRKYFNDLKEKYGQLLDATNQMAQGRLDVEIEQDLGIFNPFKTEIKKIQDGYQKAVEKEVKSERMKTELITNVSHDLKTPLTAIITYVNLLKEESDEEKRKDYIDVLDRKSLRLKVLIEDLFEISKASSKNATLHLVDVDVVNLFKQVKLEHLEKFEKAELDFRCTYPEEKVICELDSQKTYRIFENLLVNVAKYALTKTRVYVKIEKKEEKAYLQIMNVSAGELDFNADEITERFVRGDTARNTEGSGLGLAIAKSFTELQKGSFRIETEGDLFKAEVTFPVKTREETKEAAHPEEKS